MNKEIFGWYIGMSAGERVDYLYMNYQNIQRILSSQQEALAMRVNMLRESSIHHNEELGVTVMTSRSSGGITERQAEDRVYTLECVKNYRLPNSVLIGIEDTKEIKDGFYELVMLRLEYDLFKNRIGKLSEDDGYILLSYVSRKKSVEELSEMLAIEPESVRKKLYRIKKKLKAIMLPLMLKYEEQYF